jgi:Flp pilus assembly protein TadG
MSLRKLLRRVRASKPLRMLRSRSGSAAVEFAIITPAMLTIFFGTAEVSTGVAIDRKVVLTARALSDLVAQQPNGTINDTDMTNILNAASAVMSPYSTSTQLHIKVSAVNIDSNGVATVGWGKSQNATARAKGEVVSIPSALAVPNSQLIWSEIAYDYRPAVGYVVTGTLNLSDQFFARPRDSSTICWVTCS